MAPYYEQDGIVIYHGDCRDVLPLSCDVVVTDPPYGVGFDGKNTKHTKREESGYDSGFEDTPWYVENIVVPTIREIVSSGLRAVVTPGTRNAFLYPPPDAMGCFFYPSGAGLGRWGFTCSQPILYYGKCPYLATGQGHRPDSYYTTEAAENNGHPCPKPIGAMSWLVIKASLPRETVLDPFMGSGTTLVAAKRLGRKAIGIEIEEKYCEIAAKRLAQGALDLFGEATA